MEVFHEYFDFDQLYRVSLARIRVYTPSENENIKTTQLEARHLPFIEILIRLCDVWSLDDVSIVHNWLLNGYWRRLFFDAISMAHQD